MYFLKDSSEFFVVTVETKELQQHVYEGICARPYIKGNVQLPADVGMIMVLRKGPYTVVDTHLNLSFSSFFLRFHKKAFKIFIQQMQ